MNERHVSLLDMTVGIVTHYVSRNSLAPASVAELIVSTHAALNRIDSPAAAEPETFEQPTAARIRRSITETGLVSFLDGKTYKSLKRHLGARGLTPQDYRTRYNLPGDYPMVSPAYSAQRSALARTAGLGKGGHSRNTSPRKA